MACLVCDHSKRWRLEQALREGKPKQRVAKDFGIARTTLIDHIKLGHERSNPAKEPTEVEDVDPFPDDLTVRGMSSRSERLKHVNRLLMGRRYRGAETIAKLARLWREMLGSDAEMHVAQLVAECARRHKLTRGPKDVQKELAYIALSDIHQRCLDAGDYKTALSALQAKIDLAGLKDDPVAVHKQIIAQFVQIVQVGAPHLLPSLQEVTARLEEGYEQAKAIVEGDVLPLQMASLPELVIDAPTTSRSTKEKPSNHGIDTGT